MSKVTAETLRKKYDFRWEVLDIIINGRSSIDSSQGFQISTLEDANRFVTSYGYDLENPIERAQAFGNFHESLNFIRRYFLHPENFDGLKIEVPRKILELTDVRELFLLASSSNPGQGTDRSGLLLRNWACSVLKVMHTVAHMDQDLRAGYFGDVQQQIFDRYYKAVHRDEDGKLYLGGSESDPLRVDLVAFETKPKKGRDSTLLKLLHKPENVAEDIFDRVGIRFVTHSRFDAVRVVKFLKDTMILMPPNIKPSRSRNTLVDLERFRARLGELSTQEIDEIEFVRTLEDSIHHVQLVQDNPHSSSFYRAIQFTARQLIKMRNPIFDDLKELKSVLKAKSAEPGIAAASSIADRIDLKYLQREVRFFYPYEVQILDIKSSEENEKGRSAHSEYKRAQVQTALRRVMGPLADVGKA